MIFGLALVCLFGLEYLSDPGDDRGCLLVRRALAVALHGELAVDQLSIGGHLEGPGAALGGLPDDGDAALEFILDGDLERGGVPGVRASAAWRTSDQIRERERGWYSERGTARKA